MNYMKDVAKILGVELEEEFKIKGFEPIYKITDYGLVIKADSNNWCEMSGDTFLQLIRGDYVIRKLPWKPKEGEYYYFPAVDFQYSCPAAWHNCPIDFALKEAGMIFKTKAECEAALPALRKKYLGGENNE
mgnify:CR=1 FL=1